MVCIARIVQQARLFRAVDAKLVGLVHKVLRVVLGRDVSVLGCGAENAVVSERLGQCTSITYMK